MSGIFPFSAIVGQEDLKIALILNVIDPLIGGVLISGEKGTAKSTAVRALAKLLPSYRARACPSGCDPKSEHSWCSFCKDGKFDSIEHRQMRVVELPLGATEDRLLGSLDIKRAIQSGEKHFEPGILAFANRNFLYVDEINLLEDHLVDLLLDVSAMGMATVEREGISFTHPSRFVLVGSMNPEEGELRPQLLDRFGLFVDVKAILDPQKRLEILKRRIEFDLDHHAFMVAYKNEQNLLSQKIINAKNILDKVKMSDEVLRYIVNICANLAIDGHRGDITLSRASKAFCAFEDRIEVLKEDVAKIASLVLLHRQKRLPFESVQDSDAKLEKALKESL
ncbi:ATP-binding protein [Campylobacter sp.]|uniref:ATP-binding protein n=1 Tax=Campylobacter sp. TaxID=205 RepID=UPI0026FB406D|nr:ATP-binding protein [Campylobacter sp.]